MDIYKKHIELIGYRAKDRITGFEGTIESIAFDLYGCVQGVLRPRIQDAKFPDGHWFDVSRLDVDTSARVMDFPNFSEGYVASGRKGPADKPVC